MYQHCIYCSADLGANQVLESFPVGRRVAFDAARGRLWAVCGRCGRWNLAPIEARWEPVEQAERAFRDTRLRAQSENVGLARLPDGTGLIRVGEALPGELAAWRYGDQLLRRRRRYLVTAGAAVTGAVLLAGGLAWATASAGMLSLVGNSQVFVRHWQRRRVVSWLPAERTGLAKPLQLRRWHVESASLRSDGEGGLALEVPYARRKDAPVGPWGRVKPDPSPLVLGDEAARSVLARAAVHLNAQGATRGRLSEALGLLTAGGAEAYLRSLSPEPRRLTPDPRKTAAALDPADRLALEMALHEAQERRALEGELAALEAAWREAEEIAGIADRLALQSAG